MHRSHFRLIVGVLVAALIGLLLMRRWVGWSEKLLVGWTLAPLLFFQLWPVKGFQYLLPVVTPLAILAARGLLGLPFPRRLSAPRVDRKSVV